MFMTVVLKVDSDIAEEYTASIFRTGEMGRSLTSVLIYLQYNS